MQFASGPKHRKYAYGRSSREGGKKLKEMVELTRTNDPVLLSWLVYALAAEDIEAVVFDGFTSVMEGSISAIPRRVMVVEEDLARARIILHEGEQSAKNEATL